MIGKCGSEGNDRFRVLSLKDFIKNCPSTPTEYYKCCMLNGHSCDDCYSEYRNGFRR
jgi:hypothetical protein